MSYHHYHGKRSPAGTAVLIVFLITLLLAAALLALLYLRRVQGNGPGAVQAGGDPIVSLSPIPSSPSPAPDTQPPASPSAPEPEQLPWYLTLVNPTHAMPEDLAVVTEPLDEDSKFSFDARAVDALREMLAGCQEAGLQPLVCSAYRTQETQEKLFQNKVNQFMALGYAEKDATEAAGKIVAVPGTSEHQLGLAADIVDVTNQNLDKSQESTAVQIWLMEHCWEYGFILRYPNEKSEITGIIYEPWHYRYVGKEYARKITESGLCLEEYLDQEFKGLGGELDPLS